MKITLFMLKNWRPPGFADVAANRDQQKLKRLFPAVLVTRQARSELRESALTLLDSAFLSDEEALEALLMLSWSAWSKAIAERATQRPFLYFLKQQIASGKAFQISGYPEIENGLREAFSVPVPRARVNKPSLAASRRWPSGPHAASSVSSRMGSSRTRTPVA
jgi:hypothetical protein